MEGYKFFQNTKAINTATRREKTTKRWDKKDTGKRNKEGQLKCHRGQKMVDVYTLNMCAWLRVYKQTKVLYVP